MTAQKPSPTAALALEGGQLCVHKAKFLPLTALATKDRSIERINQQKS